MEERGRPCWGQSLAQILSLNISSTALTSHVFKTLQEQEVSNKGQGGHSMLVESGMWKQPLRWPQ